MRIGRFDDGTREYVIEDPRTPTTWINYVGSPAFGGFLDAWGGANLCAGDPALGRVTKYLPQVPEGDFRGETCYLRIRRTGRPEARMAPYWSPIRDPLDAWECRVGLGYSRYAARAFGVRVECRAFVPPGTTFLVREYGVANLGPGTAEVDLIPAAEVSHFDALKQLANADWVPQTMRSRSRDDGRGGRYLAAGAYMRESDFTAYYASDVTASSWACERRDFLGPAGSWAAPASLDAPELPSRDAERGDPVLVLLLRLGGIPEGQSRTAVVRLGFAPGLQAADREAGKPFGPGEAESAFRALAADWDRYLSVLRVETPDGTVNSNINIHGPWQARVATQWSRYLSRYQLGYGRDRGMGVRDTAQDLAATAAADPDLAAGLLRSLLGVQRPDGSAYHQFNPLTGEASEGDSLEYADRFHWYSDDHLWIVLAASEYLKESGNTSFLDEEIPYYPASGGRAGSVRDHLERALAFTEGHKGRHGLPLLGFADWNDTFNLPSGSESVFTACLYGAALREYGNILRFLSARPPEDRGLSEKAKEADRLYWAVSDAVNREAWDGNWYVRYFDETGRSVGAAGSGTGALFLNAQSWPILAGFATPERAESSLRAVRDRLDTGRGLKLFWPPYADFDRRVGGVTTYPPGAKENAGVFLHSNPWAMIASVLAGDGDTAWRWFAQTNPAARNDEIERWESEPYVYPQNVLGNDHPLFGVARNSWLTGTAGWMYRAVTQRLLGIRPELGGLRVDPRLPSGWDGFTAERRFRGALYRIRVRRGAEGAGPMFSADGREAPGGLVPVFGSGTHEVAAEV